MLTCPGIESKEPLACIKLVRQTAFCTFLPNRMSWFLKKPVITFTLRSEQRKIWFFRYENVKSSLSLHLYETCHSYRCRSALVKWFAEGYYSCYPHWKLPWLNALLVATASAMISCVASAFLCSLSNHNINLRLTAIGAAKSLLMPSECIPTRMFRIWSGFPVPHSENRLYEIYGAGHDFGRLSEWF